MASLVHSAVSSAHNMVMSDCGQRFEASRRISPDIPSRKNSKESERTLRELAVTPQRRKGTVRHKCEKPGRDTTEYEREETHNSEFSSDTTKKRLLGTGSIQAVQSAVDVA